MSVSGNQPDAPSSQKPNLELDLDMDLDGVSVSISDDDETLFSPSRSVAFFQSFPRGVPAPRPLISYVTNKWETASRPRSVSTASTESYEWARNSWIGCLLSCLTAPKFQRYIAVYFVLVMFAYIGWDVFL